MKNTAKQLKTKQIYIKKKTTIKIFKTKIKQKPNNQAMTE